MNNRKGEATDFLRHFSVHPNIVIHLIPQPLVETLDTLMRISSLPVTLHYDTVFNMGDFYLSTLVFRHDMFKGNPIIPVGYFVHSRRFHEDHINFLTTIRKTITLLSARRVILVTDREFDFAEVFPLGMHIYCWNHLEQDLIYYLKTKANASANDISFYVQNFKKLMMEETEDDFDKVWGVMRVNQRFQGSKVVLNYFDNRLLPQFKAHASIWVLKAAGVQNPDLGITNNPSESMNAVLHALQNWKQVPLDMVCLSLYHLSNYYHREFQRAIHQLGNWNLKDEYFHLLREPSLMPFLPKVSDPKEIVDRVKSGLLPSFSIKDETELIDEQAQSKSESTLGSSMFSLAIDAVEKRFVTLADTGCWVVRATDGKTPYAVRLFPKESCSCAQGKGCYHILACRLMMGQEVKDFIPPKPNLSTLQQQTRRKGKEKPAGRKVPRRNDFMSPDTRSLDSVEGKLPIIFMCTCMLHFLNLQMLNLHVVVKKWIRMARLSLKIVKVSTID